MMICTALLALLVGGLVIKRYHLSLREMTNTTGIKILMEYF